MHQPLAKTFSFAVVHFVVAFTVSYLLTGNLLVASAVALIEPACNTVAYYFHELAWTRRAFPRPIARTEQVSLPRSTAPAGA